MLASMLVHKQCALVELGTRSALLVPVTSGAAILTLLNAMVDVATLLRDDLSKSGLFLCYRRCSNLLAVVTFAFLSRFGGSGQSFLWIS
jgi:hypothetical protein